MAAAAALLLLAACAGPPGGPPATPEPARPAEVRARVARLMPAGVTHRDGWAMDIQAAFTVLQLTPSVENLCAVLAVTEQESGYQVDPPVPRLAEITWQEIDRRAERLGVPRMVVRAALQLQSPDGRSWADRIDAARTEQALSRLFEDMIGMLPLGRRLFGGYNPVRTGGPMQVSIRFAEEHAAARPYPYPLPAEGSLRHEVFTRRGGLYFGIAHLLDYPADYEQPLYRFADFNAGHHASRNAAFQQALSMVSGVPLALDGDLVRHGEDDDAPPGETESAALAIAARLGLDAASVRRALAQGDSPAFERTELYRQVFLQAERIEGRALPRARLPRITLQSPKIQRKLTTEWFARRVDERYRRCLARRPADGG
ncbi:DUF1615 domain-containing protein (plasmid) [Eleftheria terrae]|nr:DUF1615 domain-containing protein [Eleftheria terrae]